MSRHAKIYPIDGRRREDDGEEDLRKRIRALEEELAQAQGEVGGRGAGEPKGPQEREGLMVVLARLLQEGLRGVTWENTARLLATIYFSWHTEEVDEFGYDRRFTQTLMPLLEFLYAVWWRVEVTGVTNIPAEGPALIVANHSGVLPWDGVMVSLAVRQEHPARRECRMLVLDMFALVPFLAPLVAQTGGVRASQENGERLLRKGELVGVFPEGVKGIGKHFKDRYKLARFGRGGFVRLALRTGAPIVPCAIVGAEEIHPLLANAGFLARAVGVPYLPLTPTFPLLGPLGFVPLPSKWSIDFGDPIPVDKYGPEAAEDPILVNHLAQEVRSNLQKIIDGRLARRRSVWFG
jgi:1-acyl-sn-glycerol-3-phosphate acyltransferase